MIPPILSIVASSMLMSTVRASGVAGPLALVLLALDTLEQSYSNLSIFGALRHSTCLHLRLTGIYEPSLLLIFRFYHNRSWHEGLGTHALVHRKSGVTAAP
jgi:hypothetical protein